MRGRRAGLVPALPLILLVAVIAPACSGAVTREPARSTTSGAAEVENGEVLSEDPFPAREETTADRMGGALVAVTFVVAIVAAAVLPLLLFL